MDPYDVLGIPRTASLIEIRKRYKYLAKECHPDKNNNAPEKTKRFQEIEHAYKEIVDPDSLKGSRPADPPPPPPPPPPPSKPKFKKGQNLDDFLKEQMNDGMKKAGKRKDKWG